MERFTFSFVSLSVNIITVRFTTRHFEKSLKPLHELKVVHVSARNKSVHINNLLDFKFGKTSLKNFIIGHNFKILLRGPVHFMHWNLTWVHDIQKLASNRSIGSVLHFCQVQIESGIYPIHDFKSTNKKRTFHETNVRHFCELL